MYVYSFKYLGIELDRNLDLDDHLEKLAKQSNRKLYLIKRIQQNISVETSDWYFHRWNMVINLLKVQKETQSTSWTKSRRSKNNW